VLETSVVVTVKTFPSLMTVYSVYV